MHIQNMNRFLFMGDTPVNRPSTLSLTAQRGEDFFAQIEKKYRVKQAFERFPLYFLRLPSLSDSAAVEYRLSFKPVFHWTLVTPSLTRSLTLSVTRWLTQLLTRSFSRSTSIITHLHEGKREPKSEYAYLIYQSPDAAVEGIRADIFNYFATLNKIAAQFPAVSPDRLILPSLTRSLTPALTQSLTTLLTRSFDRSTSLITHRHEKERVLKSEGAYLIHQSPDAAAERIRAGVFNYFATLNKVWATPTSPHAPPFGLSIDRLMTRSLTPTLTTSFTRSLTQLLTRSFIRSTSFITHLHEEKREQERETEGPKILGEHFRLDHRDPVISGVRSAEVERLRADIFNYFSTLSKITREASAASINRLITSSLTRSLTPSVTRSLTQLLARSFDHSTSIITHPHLHETGPIGQIGPIGPIGQIGDRPEVTFIHQHPDTAAERIRADIFNYFSTLNKVSRQVSTASINRLITRSLTRSLTPSLTRSLTQFLTHSFIYSPSFITHLQSPAPGESPFTFPIAETGDTYLIHQSPDASAERIRANIFNYFSTLGKFTRQSSAVSINRLITLSLTRSLTPSVTRSLTQLLTRSFIHSTSFITQLHEDKKEIKSERVIKSEKVKELEITAAAGERTRDRTLQFPAPGTESPFTFPISDTGDTYLSHQSPDAAAERLRADIFNYFSTLSRVWAAPTTPHAPPGSSIDRLITQSLIRSLTPSLTRSLTQFLTHSFIYSPSFISHLHEEKKEIKSSRILDEQGIPGEHEVRPYEHFRIERRGEPRVRPAEARDRTLQFLAPGTESPFTFPIADTGDTYLIHQSPDAGGERIRADIFNYFSTLNKFTRQTSNVSINRLITQSLASSLTPSLIRSLTQFLTHSFIRSTSFITLLHEQKKEIKSERVKELERESKIEKIEMAPAAGEKTRDEPYFIHQSPDDAGERIRADIFNYFATLNKVWAAPTTPHAPPFGSSTDRLITPSLTPPLTPSLTRSLTQLLTRSFNRFNSFITHLHEQKIEREKRSEKVREKLESSFTFPIAGTGDTYLIHQSPDTAGERIRADIFNYFATFNKMLAAPTPRDVPPFGSSVNRLTTPFLTPASAPSVTQAFTQLLTRSFSSSTSFINHFHEGNRAFITYLSAAAAGEKTRDSKLEMEKPAPQTFGEAVKQKVTLPEMSAFERERLELRYTSAFYLAGKGKQDTQVPHTHTHLSMPVKEWLSSGAVKANIVENGHAAPEGAGAAHFLEKGREQAAAGRSTAVQRIIDLSSLAEENDSQHSPVIKHAPPPENGLSEERIKKIEHTIASHTKQFETRMKDAVTTSASSFAAGISSGVTQDMNISSLTDNIYNLLLERVKRERRMVGY